jgi:mannose-6-phosphate isomerase
MHLLEAFLALHSATNNSYWLNRCAQIIDLFSSHFFDAQHGVLLENFNENWSPLPDLDKNNIVEPGHMLEWVWLIGQYSCQSGIDMKATMLELYNSALKIGVSSSGLIYDAVTIDGSPLLRTKRCWPMTEYIKASVSIAELGLELGLTEGTKAIHKLMKYYFKENLAGTYIDQLDADDQVISAVSPASTLYHIVVAAGEAARLRNALLLRTYQENTNFVQL